MEMGLDEATSASPPSERDDGDAGDEDSSHPPAMSPAMAAEMLLRHVHVNAIADYYDVPPLKELANMKIQHILETTWSAHGFSDVIKEVFSATGDMRLREMITLTAATHIEELVELDDFAALEVMSDFAINIVRNMITACKAVKSQLKVTEYLLRTAEHDCTYQKSLVDGETMRANRIIENIHNCTNTLRQTSACRNNSCTADFACYIERVGSADEPRYMLRCARCRCRHG
jgi:hypothetical protein